MILDPIDTSPEARKTQEEVHRRLGPDGRLRLALDLSEAVLEVRLAAQRKDHPALAEAAIMRRYIAEAHGVVLEAWP